MKKRKQVDVFKSIEKVDVTTKTENGPPVVSAGGAGGAGPGQQGPDVHRGGPPAVHHPKRRPHRRPAGRSRGRTGDTSTAAGQEGSLLHAGHYTVGPREGMREDRESTQGTIPHRLFFNQQDLSARRPNICTTVHSFSTL